MISVVVPTKDTDVDQLIDLIQRIETAMSDILLEIIVVDQTVARTSSLLNVRHICTTEPKSAISARQLGAELAQPGLIMFVDDDIYFKKTFTDSLKKIDLSEVDVISPILFDQSHGYVYCLIRAMIELMIFGARDRRAINRCLEKYKLGHISQRYLWGGCFILRKKQSIDEESQLYNLVKCPGHPIQMGDILLGEELCNRGHIILTYQGLCVEHKDPHFGTSEKYLENRLNQIDEFNYNLLQAWVFRTLIYLSVLLRK